MIILKHFYPDWHGLSQDDPTPIVAQGPWCTVNNVNQLTTSVRFWTDVLESIS